VVLFVFTILSFLMIKERKVKKDKKKATPALEGLSKKQRIAFIWKVLVRELKRQPSLLICIIGGFCLRMTLSIEMSF